MDTLSAAEVRPAARGSAEIVDDYEYFREGDIEPHLGKKIHCLIYKEKTFIVFLDPDLHVEWAYTRDYQQFDKEAGAILNRVSELQALPVSHLEPEHRVSYRMLIGESVARVLANDVVAAREALEKAEQLLLARNTEIFRWWYLIAAVVAAAIISCIALVLWLCRFWVEQVIGGGVFELAMCAGAGALGAALSVVVGSRLVVSESASSARIHYFHGAAKIVGGTLGAVVIALAVKTGWLLGPLATSESSGELLLLVSMLAGASERLVPNFIEQAEKKASGEV